MANYLFGKMLLALTTVLLVSVSAVSAPIPYSFEYEFASGDLLSAVFEGELQPDGDTIFITTMNDVSFTGQPAITMHTGLLRNVVSISGTNNDLVSFSPTPALAGFVLPAELLNRTLAIVSVFDDFLYLVEDYSAARWSLTPRAASVPVPPTIALVLVCGVLFCFRRTKP